LNYLFDFLTFSDQVGPSRVGKWGNILKYVAGCAPHRKKKKKRDPIKWGRIVVRRRKRQQLNYNF
jgi:hypothetical protein